MKPVVDGLAKEYQGKVEFRRYNLGSDQAGIELAGKLGVTAVPTFLFVNADGVTSATKVGPATADEMRSQLDRLL
jgi:thioredoxin-like negative regulator of GroEL